MDPIIGSNIVPFNNHQQRLSHTGSRENVPLQEDGFSRGFERSSTLDKAEALKRLAATSGKSEIAPVAGFLPGNVENSRDLSLNGLHSTEILYLGLGE